jgi:hypothetical protein
MAMHGYFFETSNHLELCCCHCDLDHVAFTLSPPTSTCTITLIPSFTRMQVLASGRPEMTSMVWNARECPWKEMQNKKLRATMSWWQ